MKVRRSFGVVVLLCTFAVETTAAALIGMPEVSFPAFNAATITGDELVVLCAKVDRQLTEEEVDSLREQVAGRRLTFTFGAWQTGGWGRGLACGEFMDVKFPDNGLLRESSGCFVVPFLSAGRD